MKLKKKIGIGVLSLATVLGSATAMLTNNTSSVSAATIEGTSIGYNDGKLYLDSDGNGIQLFYSSFKGNYQMLYWTGTVAVYHVNGVATVNDDGTITIEFGSTLNQNNVYTSDTSTSTSVPTIVLNNDTIIYKKYNMGQLVDVIHEPVSADITSDNQQAIDDYIVQNNLKTENEYLEYGESKYLAGQESIDITSNDKEVYDKGFEDGVASLENVKDDNTNDVVIDQVEEEKENWFVSVMKWINQHLFFGFFGD